MSDLGPNAGQMETIIATIRGIRNARGELKIAPSVTPTVTAVGDSAEKRQTIEENRSTIESLARVLLAPTATSAPAGHGIIPIPIQAGLDVYLEHAVDVEKEKARLFVDITSINSDIIKVETKLANPQFVAKAAPDIVARDRARLAELQDKLAKLEARRSELGG